MPGSRPGMTRRGNPALGSDHDAMDFSPVFENLPRLLEGFVLTIELTAGALIVGMCLAVPLALLRVSRHWFLWMPAYGYIFFLRGSPLLIQIFLIYYGI